MEGIGDSVTGRDLDLPILPLFCQLNIKEDESNKSEWKETSRWVKISERVSCEESAIFFFANLSYIRNTY